MVKAVVKALVGSKQGLWPCGGLDNPPCSRKLQGPVQAARTELTPPLDTQIGLSDDPSLTESITLSVPLLPLFPTPFVFHPENIKRYHGLLNLT